MHACIARRLWYLRMLWYPTIPIGELSHCCGSELLICPGIAHFDASPKRAWWPRYYFPWYIPWKGPGSSYPRQKFWSPILRLFYYPILHIYFPFRDQKGQLSAGRKRPILFSTFQHWYVPRIGPEGPDFVTRPPQKLVKTIIIKHSFFLLRLPHSNPVSNQTLGASPRVLWELGLFKGATAKYLV